MSTFNRTMQFASVGLLVIPGSLTFIHANDEIVASPPNILWITTEDLSPHLGCYGDLLAKTPNIDKLASEGVRFTNVFTTAAISAPCRAGIITGMYQNSIGCMHMRTSSFRRTEPDPLAFSAVPPHYVKAFTEYLRAHGYYCTNNSKTDYQFSSEPVPASIWDDCSKTAHYRNRTDKSMPFFAVFNFTKTHESNNWESAQTKTNPDDVKVPPYYANTSVVRQNMAKLYDNIARLDTFVGNLLHELDQLGLAENTIVFFYSDHGDGLPRSKRWLYDSGLHIPLIIRWPGGLKEGSIDNRLISSIDFGPTALSLAGVAIPSHMQGIPFLGRYAGPQRTEVYAARDRVDESYDMVRSVRSQRFLYIRNYYCNQSGLLWVPYANRMPIMQEMLRLESEGTLNHVQRYWISTHRSPEELYDVKADPFQVNNLADNPKYTKVLTDMRALQDQWEEYTGDMGLENETEMIERMWPGKKQPITESPYFIIYSSEDQSGTKSREGGSFSAPALMSLYNPQQGVSMVYTLQEGPSPEWKIYTTPLVLSKGRHSIRVRSFRYGYREAEEMSGDFIIE